MRRRSFYKRLLLTALALLTIYVLYARIVGVSLSPTHERSLPYQPLHSKLPPLPPFPPPPGCRQVHCKEFLSASEGIQWRKCSQKAAAAVRAGGEGGMTRQGTCRFVNGTGRDPVALLSHPGSGNTWLRALLEAVTGICTGAIYCDVDLRARGFAGEGVKGSSVLVVKSHDSSSPWGGPPSSSSACEGDDRFCYGSAILLVRDPYDAFVSEWNRQVTEHILKPARVQHQQAHVNTVPDFYFSGPEWDDYLRNQTVEWETRMRRWIVLGDHPLLVVHYEDLQRDVEGEVGRVLKFLQVEYMENELRQRVSEASSSHTTTFKRKKNTTTDYYTVEHKLLINFTIQKVKVFLAQYNMEDLLKVERYLRA